MSTASGATGGGSTAGRGAPDAGAGWGARLRYHGARLLLIVALAVGVALLFPPAEGARIRRYEVGMVAPEEVIARIPFEVPKTAAELERDRGVAMESVPPTFRFREEAVDSVSARLANFFDRLENAAATRGEPGIDAVLRRAQIRATASQLGQVRTASTRNALREAAIRSVIEILPRGVADAARMIDLTTGSLTIQRGGEEEVAQVEEVLTSRDFFAEAVLFLPPALPPEVQDLLRLILIHHVEFTLVLEVEETESDRAAAAASVPLTKAEVLRGQAIVRAADPIGPETLERLEAYEQALSDAGLLSEEALAPSALLGATLLNLLLFSIFGLFLLFSRPEVYGNFRWLLLIALLVGAYFGAGVVIDRGGFAPEWLPIAFVALPVAALWDSRIALVLVFVVTAVTGSLTPFSDDGTVLALTAGGSAAGMSVRAVRRRSETWVSIAIILAVSGAVLHAHGLATGRSLGDVLMVTGILAGSVTVSALLAMGFLWVFELFTGITTDQTLLEWADPARPLLRQLSMEAPGTYAHTINVANLAEAAATAIGANGLLCRVGVLYHDVGKMLKPYYFVENQPEGRNPHDRLDPEDSAAIVREHVTEGARLAREAKVPAVIVDFILEHHGTQRIGFFYERARESKGEVDAAGFSYPGPRPRSRETAISMLADSCESAAKAMQEPTPERVRALIDNIVAGKIAEGQLDESPLTLRELAQVKEQFAKILSGVRHRRIEYPATKHLTDAERGPERTGGEGRATSATNP